MQLNRPIIQQFLTTQPVRRAYLFGSQARNESTSESDVDILVELDDTADLFQFANMQLQLSKLLQMPVDLVSANGVSPYIRPFIEQDKILIYEKQDQ
ncbi:nucleotidyltransferase family protein [Spirosoma montaniterrae]|uniref:Nucleotidyltransferase n=1 Tax=Spirosoma montaniterrae TaxID=1178516 RepID=A0A1P9WYH4_9BACT|nr:nucleotidyltransferase family protein [Spirosoma montaniterrae]AQG80437.1 nucleotidyltransferase [Spirosoma montaniterrae]